MHTMTTAGYGVVAPFSMYCNNVVLAHCWITTIFIALVTSILLLNITRPKCAPPHPAATYSNRTINLLAKDETKRGGTAVFPMVFRGLSSFHNVSSLASTVIQPLC